MARDDDPEARMRELERTLSEQAKTSELTAPGYNWPSARPAQRSTARPILLSLIAVGAVAAPVVAAVMFFAGDFPTGGPPVAGTPSAGHQPVVSLPAAPPAPAPTDSESSQSVVVNGTTVLAGPGLVDLPGQSDGPGGPIQIAGVGGSRTVACNDRPVSISGVSNTVVLTGHCASVNVSGIDNTITVDSAAQIFTSDMRNRVTYHSGTPDIPDPGESNIVERG